MSTDKSQTLRELASTYAGVIRACEDMPEEVLRDTLDSMSANENLTQKLDALAHVIRRKTNKIDACKAEKERMDRRIKHEQREIDRIRDYVAFWMGQLNHHAIETDLNTARLQKGPPSVCVDDEEQLPLQYLKTTTSVDRRALLADLKKGEEIPGCHLVEGKLGLRMA